MRTRQLYAPAILLLLANTALGRRSNAKAEFYGVYRNPDPRPKPLNISGQCTLRVVGTFPTHFVPIKAASAIVFPSALVQPGVQLSNRRLTAPLTARDQQQLLANKNQHRADKLVRFTKIEI